MCTDCPAVLPTLVSFVDVLNTFAFFPECLRSFTLTLQVLGLLNLYHLNYSAFIIWACAICFGQLYIPATECLRGKITLREEAVILTLVSEVSVWGYLPAWFLGLWSGRTSWRGACMQQSKAGSLLLSGEWRETGGGAWARVYPSCFCLPEPLPFLDLLLKFPLPPSLSLGY